MKQQILRYWLAMNATATQAGVNALRTYCGMAGAHQVTDTIPPINWQQGVVVFLFAFGAAILNYLDANPLEKLVAAPPANLAMLADAPAVSGGPNSKANAALEAGTEVTPGTKGTPGVALGK